MRTKRRLSLWVRWSGKPLCRLGDFRVETCCLTRNGWIYPVKKQQTATQTGTAEGPENVRNGKNMPVVHPPKGAPGATSLGEWASAVYTWAQSTPAKGPWGSPLESVTLSWLFTCGWPGSNPNPHTVLQAPQGVIPKHQSMIQEKNKKIKSFQETEELMKQV